MYKEKNLVLPTNDLSFKKLFSSPENKDIHAVHKFEMYDRTNEIVLNEPYLIFVGYFEITKADKKLNKNLEYWRQFLLTGKANDNAPNYIKKAGNIINLSSFSKEERKMISVMEKREQDTLARELYVKNEGIKEGELIGIKIAMEKIALNLIKTNMPIKQICEITGLSEEEIIKLEGKTK